MSDNHTVSLRPAPATVSAVSTPPPQQSRRYGKIITVCIVVGLLAGAAWWYVTQSSPSPTAVQSTTQVASTTTPTPEVKSDDMVARVGALIDLPVGETPTIATVSDPSKLEGQAFFAKAKKGDVVLIYTTAREAYLYDPARNKLIEVAPITTSTATATTSPAQTGAPKK
jgi:hypothetical protein